MSQFVYIYNQDSGRKKIPKRSVTRTTTNNFHSVTLQVSLIILDSTPGEVLSALYQLPNAKTYTIDSDQRF
jgi:hypothetical protein